MRLWLWRLNCAFVTIINLYLFRTHSGTIDYYWNIYYLYCVFVTVAFIFCICDYGIYVLSLWLWRIDMKMMSGGIFNKICCSIKYWNISQFLHVYREPQGNIKLSILSIKVPTGKPGEIYPRGNLNLNKYNSCSFFVQAWSFKVQDGRKEEKFDQ